MFARFLTPVMVLLMAGAVTPAQAKVPATDKEKLGYTVGHQLGQTLKNDKDKLDVEALIQGLRDQLSGAKPQLTPEQMSAVAQNYQKQAVAARQALGARNAKAAADFLVQNGKRPGVVKLPSGLQYESVKKGAGPTPTAQDKVKVHYRGTLRDGTEFDSSYKRGAPTVLPVGRVVPGWREALTRMKVGDRWKLYVPPTLAYGENGAPGRIGPNELLIFELELLGIEPKGP